MRAQSRRTLQRHTRSVRSKRTSQRHDPVTMPLTVSSRFEDKFAVLELAGSLTLGPTLSTLREAARRTLDTNKVTGMILRVAGVTTVDSAGLGELTVVYTSATRRGCAIMLVEVNPTL